jgi:hypothetical protein
MVCISINNDRHPGPKTFTPLHYTSHHFTIIVDTSLISNLNFTHLNFKIKLFNVLLLMLLVCYFIQIKLVLRYKVLISGSYYPQTLYFYERKDVWIRGFCSNPKGLASKKFGGTLLYGIVVLM